MIRRLLAGAVLFALLLPLAGGCKEKTIKPSVKDNPPPPKDIKPQTPSGAPGPGTSKPGAE